MADDASRKKSTENTRNTIVKIAKNKYFRLGLLVVALVGFVVFFVLISEPESAEKTAEEPGPETVTELNQDVTILLIDGKQEEAVTKLEDYIEREDLSSQQRASAIEQLSRLYLDSDQSGEAINLLNDYLDSNEATIGVYNKLAVAYETDGDTEQASKYYSLQLELMDKDSPLYEVESSYLKQKIQDLENEM